MKRSSFLRSFLTVIASTSLLSCQKQAETSSEDLTLTTDLVDLKGTVPIIIETSKGTIKASLDSDKAPITVKNFLSYIDQGHYDGTIFHRVMSNFMIQGGGFGMVDDLPREKPTGDGIKNESPRTDSNKRGTLAMARTNDPDSATAQFFINVVDNKSLDHPNAQGHGYAVFGKVTEGMEVVDAIKEVSTGSAPALSLAPNGRVVSSMFQNVPTEPVLIKSIRRASSGE